jgi:hypothetical protein
MRRVSCSQADSLTSIGSTPMPWRFASLMTTAGE